MKKEREKKYVGIIRREKGISQSCDFSLLLELMEINFYDRKLLRFIEKKIMI